MTLHLIFETSSKPHGLHQCLKNLTSGDTILLLGDGASEKNLKHLETLKTNTQSKLHFDYYVLEDIPCNTPCTTPKNKLVSMSEFVNLSTQHQNIHSWY